MANEDLKMPKGTEVSPKNLRTHRMGYWEDYENVVKHPALKGGIEGDTAFYGKIRELGNELTTQMKAAPETFKGSSAAIKLLKDYGYIPPAGARKFQGLEIKGIPEPEMSMKPIPPKVAVEAIKRLREASAKNYESGTAKDIAAAKVQKAIATELENLIEKNLAKTKDSKVAEKWKTAREMIAKSHDYQDALHPVTRKVDPARISQMLTEGRPISGNLKKIAESAGNLPGALVEKPEEGIFTHKVTPMAVTHPEAGAAHLLSRLGDPITKTKPYQELFVNPANKLTPEQMRLVRELMAAEGANRKEDGQTP
jgi:hypothetical protein